MNQTEVSMSVNTASNMSPGESMLADQQDSQTSQSESTQMNIFGSNIYQKLPHPFNQKLKELPIADGSDVNLLCDFLLGISHMNRIRQIMVPMIHELLLYPYCRGEGLDLLIYKLFLLERV
jgi:hypothetical protein